MRLLSPKPHCLAPSRLVLQGKLHPRGWTAWWWHPPFGTDASGRLELAAGEGTKVQSAQGSAGPDHHTGQLQLL